MKNKDFIVFLDVDGVLNAKSTVERTPDGYKGIADARVEILAKSIQKIGGSDIVLTSDWKEMKTTDDDYVYLCSKLKKYNLSIAAHTNDKGYNRGEGILEYLKEHSEVKEYVILDDFMYDFSNYTSILEHLLITDGIEMAKHATQTPAVEAIIFLDYIKEFSE